MTTVYSQMYPGDVNFLDSVESYLRKIGVPNGVSPQEKLAITESARNTLYSYDVQCLPHISEKILNADMEVDGEARALWIALCNHVMDPAFISIMMQFLQARNDSKVNGLVGALLSKVLDRYLTEHWKNAKKDDKKDGKKDAKNGDNTTPDFEEVKHIQAAVESLLGATAAKVQTSCGNLTHPEALFIAACLAMNSQDSIKEILRSDLPITADIFQLLEPPDNIVRGAVLLLKADVPTKPTNNQSAFLESLKRWTYDKLNGISTTQAYQWLVDVYGSMKPDVSPYYIQIKDCGTSKSNLLQVAKQIVNK